MTLSVSALNKMSDVNRNSGRRFPTHTGSTSDKFTVDSDSRPGTSPTYANVGGDFDQDRTLQNSQASRSFEDTPFIPPLESDSGTIRTDLPQLYDRERPPAEARSVLYRETHPTEASSAGGSQIPFDPTRFIAPETYQHHGPRSDHAGYYSSRTSVYSPPNVHRPASPRLSGPSPSALQSTGSPPEPQQSSRRQRYDNSSPSSSLQKLRIPDAGPALREQLRLDPTAPVNLQSLPDPSPGMRPSQPLPLLTKLAIYGSPRKMLTLQEIYAALEERFEWYRLNKDDKAWKNSIRHNLSLNKVFRAVPRPITEPGKGSYWCVDLSEGEGYKRPRKRRTRERPGRSNTDGEADESSEGDYDSSPPADESRASMESRYHGHQVGEGRIRWGSRRSSPYQRSESPAPVQVQGDLSLNTGVGSPVATVSPILRPHQTSPSSASSSGHGGSATFPISSSGVPQFGQTSFNAPPYGQPPFAQPYFGQPSLLSSAYRQPPSGHSMTPSFQTSHTRTGHLLNPTSSGSMGTFMPSTTGYYRGGGAPTSSSHPDSSAAPMHFVRGESAPAHPSVTRPDVRLTMSIHRGSDVYEDVNSSYNFQTWTPELFQASSTWPQGNSGPHQGTQPSNSGPQPSSSYSASQGENRQ